MAEIALLSERASSQTLASLSALLAEAIKLNHAAMGNIQIYDPGTKTLQIISSQGFKMDFLSHFRIVKAADSTACGRAAGNVVPVIIPDVTRELGFEPHRAIAKSADFRSVISIPVLEPIHDEWRGLILGESDAGRLLALIFTCRGDKLRPISCRPMREGERRLYEASIKES